MIRTLITTLLLSLSCGIYAIQSLPQDMQLLVFTTQHYPITGMQSYPVTLYYIDSVDNLEQSPTFQLSSNPQQAEQQAHALIRSPEFKQYENQLKQAYTGLSQAFYLGVKKVPFNTSSLADTQMVFDALFANETGWAAPKQADILLLAAFGLVIVLRSEERRVGKECRSRWSPYH